MILDARPVTTVDAGSDVGTRPLPTVGDGNQALVTGPASLIGVGPDSCTNQDPASGDRWCGFARPSTFLGGTDLWVINVSKATAGKSIRCDSSDLDCLLLTSTLNNTDLTAHSFFGDTLVYYADTTAAGPQAYAWRPGMLAGRKVTSGAGQCIGHSKSDTVLCFQNQDATTVPGQTSIDFVAGRLSVGGGAALPKLTTLLVALASDTTTTSRQFQVGASPAGDWVAWSARPTATGLETLSAQKVNDDSTRVVLGADVARWSFSGNGTKLYWLKSFNHDASSPLGTLQSASFPPDPTDPTATPLVATNLRPSVSGSVSAGDKGLVVFGPVGATGLVDLLLMADGDQPTQIKVVDRGVLQLLTVSLDGRTLTYAKTLSADGSSLDLYAGGLDLATPCTLTGTPNAVAPNISQPFVTVSEPTRTAFWSLLDAQTQELVGNYTDLPTCHTQKFASDLWAWLPAADQGVVFGDGLDGTSLADADVSLRYSQFTGGVLPATGTVVQLRANPTFAVLLPALPAVVFSINAGGDADGLYVKSDLPFAASP